MSRILPLPKWSSNNIILIVLAIFVAVVMISTQSYRLNPGRIAANGDSFDFTPEEFCEYYNEISSSVLTIEKLEKNDSAICFFTGERRGFDVRALVSPETGLIKEVYISYPLSSRELGDPSALFAAAIGKIEDLNDAATDAFKVCGPNENYYDFMKFATGNITLPKRADMKFGRVYANWTVSDKDSALIYTIYVGE